MFVYYDLVSAVVYDVRNVKWVKRFLLIIQFLINRS